MDFEQSEEQQAIRELARQILETEASIDRVKETEATARWLDDGLWKTLAEANLLGIAIGEDHGGMGMGFAELCILLEEAGRACAPGPWLATLVGSALPIAEFGNGALRSTWLPRIADGSLLVTAALDDAGSADPLAPATLARPDEGGFVLNGSKRAVPFADTAAALLIPAQTPNGVAVFLVPQDAEGLGTSTSASTTGEPLSTVTLEDVRVVAAAQLGADGDAVLRWLLPRHDAAIAAMQLGVSERAVRIAADYTSEREQFGVPVGSFQAVQHRQADSFIDLHAMRLTSQRAVWRLAEGLPATREAQVAKWWSASGGSRIANACVHLHGGLGADMDYPIHRYFIWSKALELRAGGANETLAALGAELATTGPAEGIA